MQLQQPKTMEDFAKDVFWFDRGAKASSIEEDYRMNESDYVDKLLAEVKPIEELFPNSQQEEKIFFNSLSEELESVAKNSPEELKNKIELTIEELKKSKEKIKKSMKFDDWGEYETLICELTDFNADYEYYIGIEEDKLGVQKDNLWNELRLEVKSDEAAKKGVAKHFQLEQYKIDVCNRFIKMADKKLKWFTRWAAWLKDYFFRESQDAKRTA